METPRLPEETAKEAAARQAAEQKLARLRTGSLHVEEKTSLEPKPCDDGRVIFVQPRS